MIIYLTGIDGSGKTTLAGKLKELLEKSAPCDVVWARYEPKLVKWLSAPFRKRQASGHANHHRMNAADYSRWRDFKRKLVRRKGLSQLLYFLQYLDYVWQITRIPAATSERHLIVDRYVLDFIVDQTINHGNIETNICTKRLLRRLSRFDAIFYINTTPAIALSRKSDIPSLEYLTERQAIYTAYMHKIPNGHIVTNNGTAQEAMDDIRKNLAL